MIDVVVPHASTSDPEARLARKGDGQASRMVYAGHLLMENRNGLIVEAQLTQASGTAEREAALAMIERRGPHGRRITLAADKGYDVDGFIAALRARRVAIDDHVRKSGRPRKTAIDRRTLRHPGYAISLRLRKRIEEPFGWIKTVANLRKTRHRGTARARRVRVASHRGSKPVGLNFYLARFQFVRAAHGSSHLHHRYPHAHIRRKQLIGCFLLIRRQDVVELRVGGLDGARALEPRGLPAFLGVETLC